MTGADQNQIVHASAVSVENRGVLILGPSGAGKSGLALELISRGAELISDDRTILTKKNGGLIASAPATIKGRIEARGIGLLATHPAPPTLITLAVDLGRSPGARLPERQTLALLGVEIDLILGDSTPNLAAAVHIYLKGGRTD